MRIKHWQGYSFLSIFTYIREEFEYKHWPICPIHTDLPSYNHWPIYPIHTQNCKQNYSTDTDDSHMYYSYQS